MAYIRSPVIEFKLINEINKIHVSLIFIQKSCQENNKLDCNQY